MSNRQEKIQQKIAERNDFITERRKVQLAIFESNFEAGRKMYEDNKDKITPEQAAILEKQVEENRELLEKLRDEAYPRTEA
jgi:hypothetical protein